MVQQAKKTPKTAYLQVREAAAQKGLEESFRCMCMLLNAPPNLFPLITVARNLREMLLTVEEQWGEKTTHKEPFLAWLKTVEWLIAEHQALEQIVGFALDIKQTASVQPGSKAEVAERKGRSKYPIFFALSWAHQNGAWQKSYRLLQAHLILARYDELKRLGVTMTLGVELYEAKIGAKEFAPGARFPYDASYAIRELRESAYSRGIRDLEPWRERDDFCIRWKKGFHSEQGYSGLLNDIINYCAVRTYSHEGSTTSRSAAGSVRNYHGYLAYTDDRFGFDISETDPDDPASSEGSQELIQEFSTEEQNTEAVEAVTESVASGSYLLHGDAPREGSDPSRIGTARTRNYLLEINRARLPWSGTHLRPEEIQDLLIREFCALLQRGVFVEEREFIRRAVLVAISLDTGRSLDEAAKIRIAGIKDAKLGWHRSIVDEEGTWSWPAVEPEYKKEHVRVKEQELLRVARLHFRIHPFVLRLLDAVLVLKLHDEKLLFPDLQDPEKLKTAKQEIGRWLRSIDNAGRLTISRIAKARADLITRAADGDFALSSLILGIHDFRGNVAMHYTVIALKRARELFDDVTQQIWGESMAGLKVSRDED